MSDLTLMAAFPVCLFEQTTRRGWLSPDRKKGSRLVSFGG